jgi:hypothetical protein
MRSTADRDAAVQAFVNGAHAAAILVGKIPSTIRSSFPGVISGEPSVAFEELYLALVLFRLLSCLESAEVTAPARLGISLFRIEPVFTRFQSSNHFSVLSSNSPSSPDPA